MALEELPKVPTRDLPITEGEALVLYHALSKADDECVHGAGCRHCNEVVRPVMDRIRKLF